MAAQRRYAVIVVLIMVGIVLLVANARRTADWLQKVRKKGQGIEVLLWHPNGIAAQVRKLPGNPIIYTNGAAAISFAAGVHGICYIPQARIPAVDGSRGEPDPRYGDELVKMKHDMETRGAKIVIFTMYQYRIHLATEEELKRDLPLREVARAEDGVIYELAR
jgi:hypothetical protein